MNTPESQTSKGKGSTVADEYSRLKIMLELSKAKTGLTYTELAGKTGLSNNTLIKRLQNIRDGKIVTETLRRSEKSGKPVILYELTRQWKDKLQQMTDTIEGMQDVETLHIKLVEHFKKELAKAKDKRRALGIVGKYEHITTAAMVAIFTRGLLYESENPDWNNFVSAETHAMIRRVIWNQALIPGLEKQTRIAIQKENSVTVNELKKYLKDHEK